MVTFHANPSNFSNLLQRVQDGEEIQLEPGDYKGPYIINHAIILRGSGSNTIIFTANEPTLIIKATGVHLENLTIKRTVGGINGEVALLAESNTKPTLNQVQITGTAPNVEWEETTWELPTVLEFGEIEPNWRNFGLRKKENCCCERLLAIFQSQLLGTLPWNPLVERV